MKYIIMALTVMLAAMFFILEVSKTQAADVDIYKIVFEDHHGNVIKSEYVAANASLEDYELPSVPTREGYIFLRWSYDLPNVMPQADIYVTPIYMQHQLSLNYSL